MQRFVRGQRAKISQFSGGSRQLAVNIALTSPSLPVFDFVCFGIDAQGQLSDDRYMVFFNQKATPEGAVTLEELADQRARFQVDLDKIPSQIQRLVFTANVDGAGTMASLGNGSFVLGAPAPVLEYGFAGSDFNTEGALMVGEIYLKDGEWRFWAQGQGFAGDLRALLKHFGGEEDASSTPAPTPQSAPPPPPISAPATVSAPLSPPPPPVAAGALQGTLAQAPAGGTVTLPRGELQGPIVIDRPLTLDGTGAVIWALIGPVVVIQSPGVNLRNLEIEVTAPEAGNPNSQVAIWAAPGTHPVLQSIKTRDQIIGVPAAEGQWHLPPVLNLGELAPKASNSFTFEVETAQSCEIKSTVSGVSVDPKSLEIGRASVRICVENIGADTFLAGQIELVSGGISRTIPLSGRTSAQAVEPVRDKTLWRLDSH